MPLGVFAHPLNELSDGLFGRAAAADFRHLLRHPGIFIWVLLQELQRFPEAPELGLFDRGAVALRRGTPDICFRHRRQVRGSTGARVRFIYQHSLEPRVRFSRNKSFLSLPSLPRPTDNDTQPYMRLRDRSAGTKVF